MPRVVHEEASGLVIRYIEAMPAGVYMLCHSSSVYICAPWWDATPPEARLVACQRLAGTIYPSDHLYRWGGGHTAAVSQIRRQLQLVPAAWWAWLAEQGSNGLRSGEEVPGCRLA